KSVYKRGAAALAIGYVQYYLENVVKPLGETYNGPSFDLLPNILGVKGFPLSALDWSTSDENIAAINVIEDEGVLRLTIKSAGQVTVTAKLQETDNVPQAFAGIELFSQTISVNPSSYTGGVGPIF